jgi:hypothetical protein
LDSSVAAERRIVNDWNNFRLLELGHQSAEYGPAPEAIARFQRLAEEHAVSAGLDLSILTMYQPGLYNGVEDIQDVEESFPLRVTARLFGVDYTNPGLLVQNRPPGMTAAAFGSMIMTAQSMYGNALQVPEPNWDMMAIAPSSPTPNALQVPESNRDMIASASSNPTPTETTPSTPATAPATPKAIRRARSGGIATHADISPKEPYNKLEGAPSMNLAFPSGNLTVAEIIAFCPQWLKSRDVADRFNSNRPGMAVIRDMIYELREMPKGLIISNTILRYF